MPEPVTHGPGTRNILMSTNSGSHVGQEFRSLGAKQLEEEIGDRRGQRLVVRASPCSQHFRRISPVLGDPVSPLGFVSALCTHSSLYFTSAFP